MVTVEERMRILQMLQEGKISPDAAAQLLEAMDEAPAEAPKPYEPARNTVEPVKPLEPNQKARFLRVRVTDTNSGRPRVNVRIPVSLLSIGLKLGARYSPEIEGVDVVEMLQAVQNGETGPFVDVIDHEDGEHVEVFLE